MSILYKNDRLGCINFEDTSRLSVEKKTLAPSTFWEGQTIENELVCVLEGEMTYSLGNYKNCSIAKGEILFVPASHQFSYDAKVQSELIVVRLRHKIRLCDTYSLESLIKEVRVSKEEMLDEPHLLQANGIIEAYFVSLKMYVEEGVNCYSFYNGKIRELLFLLRSFYNKRDLAQFFKLAANLDAEFSYQVIKNSRQHRTMNDLALSMNYTVSGFEKRFKRVFGMSGYKWMRQQKAREILHEISQGDRTFKEISEDFGFSTPSHFNDFCKQNLGKTPGEIRQK